MVDDLVNEPDKKFGLIVASDIDITTLLILNQVMPKLRQKGFEPVLFMAETHFPEKTKKLAEQPELKKASYWERGVLSRVIFPFQARGRILPASNWSPEKLAETYDFKINKVPNVNAQEFLDSVNPEEYAAVINVRGLQKYTQNAIDHISMNGNVPFLNAHPGSLPKFRGLGSVARGMFARATMQEGDDPHNSEIGWTIHVMNSKFDQGDIVLKNTKDPDIRTDSISNVISTARLGATGIFEVIRRCEVGDNISGYPQAHDTAKYYTLFNQEEISDFKNNGLILIDEPRKMANMVASHFLGSASPYFPEFVNELLRDYKLWLGENFHTNDNGNGHRINGNDSNVVHDVPAMTSPARSHG